MNHRPPHLLELLDLLDGRLPPERAERLRQRIGEDAEQRERWEVLLATLRVPSLAPRLGVETDIDTERLAAFVEERLPAGEQRQFEEVCWNNRWLLHEVAALRRHVMTPNGIAGAPLDVRRRLEQLWPDESTTLSLPEAEESGATVRYRRRHRSRTVWLSWMTAVAAAGLMALALFIWQTSLGRRPQPGTAETSSYEDPGSKIVAKASAKIVPPTSSRRRRNLSAGGGTEKDPDRSSFESSAPSEAVKVAKRPASDGAETTSDPDESPVPESEPPSSPEPKQRRLALTWSEVRGAVGVLDRSLGRWFGVSSNAPHHPDAYVALAASWGETEPFPWGRLSLSPESMVSVVTLPQPEGSDSPAVRIVCHYGVVGIDQLQPQFPVEVEVASQLLTLRPLREDTQVLMQSGDSEGRITVVEGRIAWEGEPLARGESLQWTGGEWVRSTDEKRPLKWSALKRQGRKLPARVQRLLLESTDLLADIRRLVQEGSRAVRDLAVPWTLSLAPETALIDVLDSADPRRHQLAVSWMIAHGLRHRPVQSALRSLGRRTQAAAVVRHLAQAIEYLHRQTDLPLPRKLVNPLVTALRHDDVRLRSLAHAVLVAAFGDRIPYDARAPAVARDRAARAWSHWVQRRYATRSSR